MHVLFVTSNRIGDAVLSSGLLAWLIESRPQARFWIVAGPAAAPLFRAAPRVERVIALGKRRLGAHWFELWRATVGRRWALVVDLRGSALAWTLLARERRALSPATGVHRVRHLAALFDLAAPPAPRLWNTDAERRRAAELLPPGGPILALAAQTLGGVGGLLGRLRGRR